MDTLSGEATLQCSFLTPLLMRGIKALSKKKCFSRKHPIIKEDKQKVASLKNIGSTKLIRLLTEMINKQYIITQIL